MKPLVVGALPTRPHACRPEHEARASRPRRAARGSACCPTAPRCGSAAGPARSRGATRAARSPRRPRRGRASAARGSRAGRGSRSRNSVRSQSLTPAAQRRLVVDVVAGVERRHAVQDRRRGRRLGRRAARRASRGRADRALLLAGQERDAAGTGRSSSATAAAPRWRRSRPSRAPCAAAAARPTAARRGRRSRPPAWRRSSPRQAVEPAGVAGEDLLLVLPGDRARAASATGASKSQCG